MGNFLAHGAGDERNVWVWLDGGMAEITPNDDSHQAACELAKGLGQRFYFKRVRHAVTHDDQWVAVDIKSPPSKGMKAFPTQDAAVMYALAKGGR